MGINLNIIPSTNHDIFPDLTSGVTGTLLIIKGPQGRHPYKTKSCFIEKHKEFAFVILGQKTRRGKQPCKNVGSFTSFFRVKNEAGKRTPKTNPGSLLSFFLNQKRSGENNPVKNVGSFTSFFRAKNEAGK